MIRYCTICGEPITDEGRLRRHSAYCRPECKRADDVERRAVLRVSRCESCGRAYRVIEKQPAYLKEKVWNA